MAIEEMTVTELQKHCNSLNIKLTKADGSRKLKKDLIKSLSSSKSASHLIDGGTRRRRRQSTKKSSKRRGSSRKVSRKRRSRKSSRKVSRRRKSRKASSKKCGSRKKKSTRRRRRSRKQVGGSYVIDPLAGGSRLRRYDAAPPAEEVENPIEEELEEDFDKKSERILNKIISNQITSVLRIKKEEDGGDSFYDAIEPQLDTLLSMNKSELKNIIKKILSLHYKDPVIVDDPSLSEKDEWVADKQAKMPKGGNGASHQVYTYDDKAYRIDKLTELILKESKYNELVTNIREIVSTMQESILTFVNKTRGDDPYVYEWVNTNEDILKAFFEDNN